MKKFFLTIILFTAILFLFISCNNDKKQTKELYKYFYVKKQNKTIKKQNDSSNWEPSLKQDGSKFRIGIIRTDNWPHYYLYFNPLIEGLTNYGWGKAEVYDNLTKTERFPITKVIATLNKKGWSNYIEFPSDAFHLVNLENRDQKALELASRKDIDMIIALGTWAGQAIKNLPNEYNKPCMVMAVSKPIKAKILDNLQDSGRDNITGRIEVDRFKRQVQLFYDIIKFKKLGVVYAGKDPNAAQYTAIPEITELSTKKGFEIIEATDVPPSGDQKLINKKYVENVESIIKQVDAFYLTLQKGVNDSTLPILLEIFNKHKIPVFYMGASEYVKKGILFSIATNWTPIGAFNARKIIQILKGEKPRTLNLIFEAQPRIAINLATARKIEYDPSVDILASADEIYTKIER